MTDIEGETVEPAGSQEIVKHDETAQQVQVFNPLDAEPVAFKRQLVSRSENYDALAMHLRNMLVPDKDFGRIHLGKKDHNNPSLRCDRPWECSAAVTPHHWSDHGLFAAGADKILGMLGLGVHYPNEQDFVRAALTGKQILDVIMKCHILGSNDQVIAEGMGACGRDEVRGSLNNTIKRACKRARVDAVLRLPSISALFEDDFLAEVARAAEKSGGNSTSSRQRQVNPKFDTGAILQVMPIGKKLKDQRFDQMDDDTLQYIVQNFDDKPDIKNSAIKALEARQANQATVTADGPAKEAEGGGRQGSDPADPAMDDWFKSYENYPEAQ